MTKLLFGLCLVLLSGCVSYSTMLRNDKGQIVQCGGWGFGVLGVPVAAAEHSDCMKKAHAAGFMEGTAVQAVPVSTVAPPTAQGSAPKGP